MKSLFRTSSILLLLVVALGAAVNRPLLRSVEKSLDERINRIWPDNPLAVVGPARGVYLPTYGAVFTIELNTAYSGISPMHTTLTAQDMDKVHRQKIERTPQLKKNLEEALVDMAASLDPVPAEEQVVLEADLDRYDWEMPGGYPAEIMLQSTRRKLLEVKQAKGAGMDAAIRVTEH